MATDYMPLPPAVEAAYTQLMGKMHSAKARGDQAEYGALLLQAWELIPEPKLRHDRAQSTVRAIVLHCRDVGRHQDAKRWLGILRDAYGPDPDPSVEFVAATVAMEAGDLDDAFALFDHLHARYGRRPFKGYDQKYLRFYEGRKKGR